MELLDAQIKGVAEALVNLTEKGVVDPVVKATVMLSDSGFASIHDAVLVGEAKEESFTGMNIIFWPSDSLIRTVDKLKGLFGAGSSSDSSSSTDSSQSTSAEGSTASPEASPSSTPKPPREESIPLTVDIKFPGLSPMSVEEKKASRERCENFCKWSRTFTHFV